MTAYSVLMSVYYKEKPEYLEASIQSLLAQTVPPSDFVLVCDGPLPAELDNVVRLYESDPVFQIIRLETNAGLGNALNEGLKYCQFELVARMDSDDIARKERCEKQIRCMQEKNVDIISGTVEEFERTPEQPLSRKVLPENNEDIRKYAKYRNPFNHPCVMFKKTAVIRAGGYQPFYLLEDYYLWIRMLLNGSTGYNIPDVILYMRAGAGLYGRRGGVKYIVSIWKFRRYLWKAKFVSWPVFFFPFLAQVGVCLMPNCLRMALYQKLLRKKKGESE